MEHFAGLDVSVKATCRRLTARPTQRLFRLVLGSHDGRALVPIPERSASPWVTSTLQWWTV